MAFSREDGKDLVEGSFEIDKSIGTFSPNEQHVRHNGFRIGTKTEDVIPGVALGPGLLSAGHEEHLAGCAKSENQLIL